jgi:anaerobic selenocysteine-containing dehydrogenase
MNSTFANLDGHRKMEARRAHILEMHADDARPRGITSGDRVRIFNDRGSLSLTAHVNGSVPRESWPPNSIGPSSTATTTT